MPIADDRGGDGGGAGLLLPPRAQHITDPRDRISGGIYVLNMACETWSTPVPGLWDLLHTWICPVRLAPHLCLAYETCLALSLPWESCFTPVLVLWVLLHNCTRPLRLAPHLSLSFEANSPYVSGLWDQLYIHLCLSCEYSTPVFDLWHLLLACTCPIDRIDTFTCPVRLAPRL